MHFQVVTTSEAFSAASTVPAAGSALSDVATAVPTDSSPDREAAMAPASSVSSSTLAALGVERMVTRSPTCTMSGMVATMSCMSWPDAGLQVPFSTKETLRFCMLWATRSLRKFFMGVKMPMLYVALQKTRWLARKASPMR